MALYTLFKFIHITATIAWIGGVFTLGVLNLRFVRGRDQSALLVFAKQSEFFGKAVIGPSAAIALIAGIVMVAVAGMSLSFWIIWGLAAIFISMGLGGTYTRRLGEKLTELAASSDTSNNQLQAVQRKLTVLNFINLLLLLSAVWVMVFKPTL